MRLLSRLQRPSTPAGTEVLTLPSGVGIRLHRPAGSPGAGPGLLWIHGGGYVIGSPAQDDRFCRRVADELGVTVAAVQYRLAPQHPYPAALEDCYAALSWLADLPVVDPARLAVAGASGGGGLAAALAFWARDRDEVSLAAQLLMYPMIDDRTSARAELADLDIRMWNQDSNAFAWSAYLGGADPAVAVPARREDLAGLAPAWIGVGTNDLFHDEDVAYAERLSAAGVPCELEVIDGVFHGFDLVAPTARVSQQFVDDAIGYLRRMLTQSETAGA
jgi:acetyl esterase/lipase